MLRDSWVLVGHLNYVICSTKLKETIKQKSSTTRVVNTASVDGRGVSTLRYKGICVPIESWPSCLVCVRDWYLTSWGRVTYICVGNLTIIGSDNGVSPSWHQSINWTNAGILLVGRLGTNFSEILIQLLAFSFKKMRLKVSTVKWRLFCLGIKVLKGRDYHLPLFRQQWFYSNGFGGANKQSLTFRSLWDVAVILKVHFSNSLYRTLACEIAPRWMPQNITHKISSDNGLVLVDPACLQLSQDLCHHMASLSHNLSLYCNSILYALRHCYVSHHSKILFCKFICTRPWGQLYGNMIYYQR